jgi:adenylate cyclase
LAATLVALGAILGSFRFMQPLSALETQLADILRVVVAPRAPEQDRRVAILTITEETLVRFPYRSPIDRLYLAKLVEAVGEAGATMIVLDILFDQPTEPAKDRALIDALRSFPGPAVTAWGDESSGLIAAQSRYLESFAAESGVVLGFANVVTDDDGVVRRFVTTLPGVDRLSLSGAAAQALSGATPTSGGLIDWRIPPTATATLFQQIPSLRLTDPPNEALRAAIGAALRGRVVFVGADLEQEDRHATPLGADPAARRTTPGVAIQAAVFTQLLDGRAPPVAGSAMAAVIAALMAATGAAIALSRWPLARKGVAMAAILLAYLAIAYVCASRGVLFLPVAPPVAAAFVASTLSLSLDGYLAHRDERFIRRAFSHYLEPSIVDQLARDPDALRLGGDRREISLMFTDIEGFTTTAEELPPDVLTRLMNDYFDEMCAVILRHGGAIDKFIGDAIVAHFGAPRAMADHALKALVCAADLDRAGERFRSRNAAFGIGATRIGVHTGVATVGNFGGRTRFDYTALGDAVNVAARLENANKRYGTRVAVSEQTVAAARAAQGGAAWLPPLQTIGKVELKGKSELVSVYAVNTEADADFVGRYEIAFALIETAPEAALAALETLARERPDDALVRWHLDRMRNGVATTVIGRG